MKKKLSSILSIILIPLFLVGCVTKENKNNNDNNTEASSESNEIEENSSFIKENELTEEGEINEECEAKDDEHTNESNKNDEVSKENMIIRIFYHDNDYKLYYVDKEVEVQEKAIIRAITEELKKDFDEGISVGIPIEAKIKDAKIEEGVLTVNFSRDSFKNINLGSGFETSMLKCMVNSYGYNLGVDKVIIKIDGKNYASGHIYLEEGEYFQVDYSGVSELKE